jgi:hypothetical protein
MRADARIDAYLDAVDRVMNSNTLLVEGARPPGEIGESLATFLHSPAFLEAFLQQDLARHWTNHHEWGEPPVPRPGTPVLEGAAPVLSPLTLREAGERMAWYLEGAPSWYACRLVAGAAGPLAGGCLAALAEQLPGVQAASLSVDFLRARSRADEGLAYFDDTPCDGAILFWNTDRLVILLTNGSP